MTRKPKSQKNLRKTRRSKKRIPLPLELRPNPRHKRRTETLMLKKLKMPRKTSRMPTRNTKRRRISFKERLRK